MGLRGIAGAWNYIVVNGRYGFGLVNDRSARLRPGGKTLKCLLRTGRSHPRRDRGVRAGWRSHMLGPGGYICKNEMYPMPRNQVTRSQTWFLNFDNLLGIAIGWVTFGNPTYPDRSYKTTETVLLGVLSPALLIAIMRYSKTTEQG